MSPRYSIRRQDTIEFSFHLVFESRGNMRFSRGAPALESNERSMSITATLPISLFKTPQLRGTIKFDDPEAADRLFHDIDVAEASDALSGALGVDIDLVVNKPEQDSG